VSSDFPNSPSACLSWDAPQYPSVEEPPPTPREWAISLLLFLLTILTTLFAGVFEYFEIYGFKFFSIIYRHPRLLLNGVFYSFPVIIILAAHELGHYLACRYYGMSCTPPYFIPIPLPLTGTLGAFIKIKSRFINKKALFDIGIAGPLAGFLFILPTLWFGVSLSRVVPKMPLPHNLEIYGDPLIRLIFAKILLGYSPAHQDLILNPIAKAAWVGLLATSLNLLPVWQLDGGHISYAIFGRSWHRRISLGVVMAMVIFSISKWQHPVPPYLLFLALLMFFGFRDRFYHPRTIWDEDKLGFGRLVLGFVALLILILSFMPVPISIS
jgi:membrane-associated protease RseP (regulator of RpoE activity)